MSKTANKDQEYLIFQLNNRKIVFLQ